MIPRNFPEPDPKPVPWFWTICAVSLFLLFSFCSQASAAEWYENGTLHQSSAGQWVAATYKNKLATAGDFIANSRDKIFGPRCDKGRYSACYDWDMGWLNTYAIILNGCIAKVAFKPAARNQMVSDIAARCIVTLGWTE